MRTTQTKSKKLATALTLALIASLPSLSYACADHPNPAKIQAMKRALERKQAPAGNAASGSAPAPASAPVSAPASGTAGAAAPTSALPGSGPPTTAAAAPGTVPANPFATIPLSQITSGAPSEVTPPLATTYQAGLTPPVQGAPALPSLTLNPSTYPPENTVPPTDSPQVSAWMKEIAGLPQDILNISPTTDGTCANDPSAVADTSRCWWTCGGCTNSTAPYEDVVTCPDKMTWGLSFDDGPAPYTPKVLNFLTNHNLNGTFFIVGSRVMERPVMLQAEAMLGHHFAVHTWSHSIPLTALSNAQVVAELGWSRRAIQEVTGLTPLYMRPPYGDIDNRVRAISLAMGLRPIIWTRNPADGAQFDTNDWKVPGGTVTGPESFQQFQSILTNATQLSTGFIVLQHDLFEQEVDLSTGYSIPAAMAAQFNLMNIQTCQKLDMTEAYLETIQDKTKIPNYIGSGPIDVKGDGNTVSVPGSGGSNSTTKGSGKGGATPFSSISTGLVAFVLSAIVGVFTL